MKKKLSFLIALALSLNITTTSFAYAAESNSANNMTTTTVTSSSVSTLTLEQALNSIEGSNMELKYIDEKIDALNKQYDRDKQQAIAIDVSNKSQSQYENGQYVQIMLQQKVTPLTDELGINDQKNSKDERLNNIKFDLEKQYMNVIAYKQQIDNINKNILNLDNQIQQLQEKIKLGQATEDQLNPLKVQKSSLLSQVTTPTSQMQQALLNVKKYLNIDLNSNLSLVPIKKDFVKFDDTDINTKISEALTKDYSLGSVQKNIDIAKMQVDIQTKYAYDSVTEPMNSQLTLQDLQNKYTNTNTTIQVYLWKAYYTLKNKEDAVQTQLLGQESAQMNYDKAKQNFANGNIDKVTLDSAELTLNNQKVSTEQAINDYMITQEQFNYVLNGHASLASSIQ